MSYFITWVNENWEAVKLKIYTGKTSFIDGLSISEWVDPEFNEESFEEGVENVLKSFFEKHFPSLTEYTNTRVKDSLREIIKTHLSHFWKNETNKT